MYFWGSKYAKTHIDLWVALIDVQCDLYFDYAPPNVFTFRCPWYYYVVAKGPVSVTRHNFGNLLVAKAVEGLGTL